MWRKTQARGSMGRVALIALAACSQAAVDSTAPPSQVNEVSTSVRWNRRAVALVVARQPASNGQAAVSRILSYVSLAQYRAALAAQAAPRSPSAPSTSAAIGAASAVVLNAFFPLDVASTEAQLNGDLAIPPWPGAPVEDAAAGEALGRSIGSAVVEQSASDSYLAVTPSTPPTGTGKWVAAGAVVRSLYGTRPFFLSAPNQFRPAAPPAFGSAEYVTALAEVRRISDTRTAEQTAIAVNWNASSGPFTAGVLNFIIDDLLQSARVSELEAARILAVSNAATFDAQIACWDAKFTFWFIRPSQADAGITMPIALPNHPSFPSGHSCMTAAALGVLADAFPAEKARLDGLVQEAGMSRVYGGIHYRFDIDAGAAIGRAVAALALKTPLK
jgi:membrane-associated phospholipid phosphatase